MKMRHLTCLVALALLATGCAGPGRVAEKPATLDQVNSALEGRTASIHLLDRRRLGNLRTVRVEADTTFFRTYGARAGTEYVLTADIAQVRYRTDAGARDGFIVGVLPGVVLGIAGLAGLQGDSDGAGIIGYSVVVGGVALAVVGGLVGVAVGHALGGEEVIVYEHPVSSYGGER